MDKTLPIIYPAFMLVMSPAFETAIRRHSEISYPKECCGLLFGRREEADVRVVEAVCPLPNVCAGSEGRRRFVIGQDDLRRAEGAAREEKRSVLGVYHSHPDREAHASEEDRHNALPRYSYIIVAVHERTAGNLFSWVIDEESRHFLREEIRRRP